MGNIIESVVECGSAYGMVCVLASLVFFYATIRFVLPYIYKIVCKICNTLVKYKDVHAKADIKDVLLKRNCIGNRAARLHSGSPYLLFY